MKLDTADYLGLHIPRKTPSFFVAAKQQLSANHIAAKWFLPQTETINIIWGRCGDVELNPVRARMVADDGKYRWSSFWGVL